MTTKQRGYGYKHKLARQKAAKLVKAGLAYCARCGRAIHPDQPWHLDHTADRTGYLGPRHRRCNVAAANKGRARRRYSRAW